MTFESGALAAIGGTSNMPGGSKIELQVFCEHGWEVGWRAVEVLDAAYRSAAQAGRPVFIEELYANE